MLNNENLITKAKLFLKQFLIILLYIGLNIGLQLLFINTFLEKGNLFMKNLCMLTIEIITLTVFIIIFRKTIVPDYNDFKENGKTYIKNTYQYYFLGLIIMFISNLIISSFIGMPTNEDLNRNYLELYPFYSIFSMVIAAPIIEELMTRVILKDAFKNSLFYCLFSGLIFGLLHVIFNLENNLIELLYIIPYGSLGAYLAKIYSKSNNVWTNIFFHAIHNLFCIIVFFIGA